jgi:hypothetical protein
MADQEEDEFAAVPARPRRRSPILGGAVLLLGGLILWHLRADIAYSFASRTAKDLGEGRAAVSALADNTYVTLAGQPDRRNSLQIEPRGDRVRQGFFRLLGTQSRIFVRSDDTTLREGLADRWTGRVRKMSAVPFAPALREYYAKSVVAQRYIALDTFTAALSGTVAFKDRAGEAMTVPAGATFDVDVRYPDELMVTLSRDKFVSLADATKEVERLGVKTVGVGGETTESFRIKVSAPAAERNAVMAKLETKELQVGISEERLSAPLSMIKREGAELRVGNRTTRWADVKSVSVSEPIVIPDDAFVLLEGDAPGRFLWAPLVAALMLAFMAFNVWYLSRRRR